MFVPKYDPQDIDSGGSTPKLQRIILQSAPEYPDVSVAIKSKIPSPSISAKAGVPMPVSFCRAGLVTHETLCMNPRFRYHGKKKILLYFQTSVPHP